MKYIYYSIIVAFVSLVIASCNTDNEGTIYSSATSEISFLWDKNDVVVGSNDTSFGIMVVRSTTNGDETFNITSDANENFSVPQTLSFADGESAIFLNISINEMEFDKLYSLTLNLPEDRLSIAGKGKTTLTISKEYEWVSLGEGKFADNWALPKQYNVEILKAEGFQRYRVLKPYTEGYKNDDGEWEDWISGEGPAYIEFWETGEGLIKFKSYSMGLNYEASSDQPIMSFYPTDITELMESYIPDISYNKKIDDKTYQLAPFYFIESILGGWDYSKENEVIVISLP